MLRVDLRELQRGPVETNGDLQPDDPVFEGLGLTLLGPVRVEGRLQATGDHDYFWRGRVRGAVELHCRRCLADIEHALDAPIDVLISGDPEAEDNPDVYPLPPTAAAIELGPVVREEVALAVPMYVLCREECAGLCPTCGADLNAGPCGCTAAEPH